MLVLVPLYIGTPTVADAGVGATVGTATVTDAIGATAGAPTIVTGTSAEGKLFLVATKIPEHIVGVGAACCPLMPAACCFPDSAVCCPLLPAASNSSCSPR